MNAETLAALRGSIAKWQAIVDGTGEDNGAENCPLCQMFRTDKNLCTGCPVAEKTGRPFCWGSPYRDFVESESDKDALIAAKAELAFLQSLLPEAEK
jgi:hypothetical protein